MTSDETLQVTIGWEALFDSQALAECGVVQMLIPRGEMPRFVEAGLEG